MSERGHRYTGVRNRVFGGTDLIRYRRSRNPNRNRNQSPVSWQN